MAQIGQIFPVIIVIDLDAVGGNMQPLGLCRYLFIRLVKSKSGAVATEYAFIVAFISIVAAIGMSVQGVSLKDFFSEIGSALSEMSCKMPDTASDNGKGKSNKCKDKSP